MELIKLKNSYILTFVTIVLLFSKIYDYKRNGLVIYVRIKFV